MGALEVQRRLGLSKKRADLLMARPDFPTATRLGRGRVWAAEDIEAWIRVHRPHLAQEADITSPENEKAPPLDHTGREAALAEVIQARLTPALQDRMTVEEIAEIARLAARAAAAFGDEA